MKQCVINHFRKMFWIGLEHVLFSNINCIIISIYHDVTKRNIFVQTCNIIVL